MSYCGDILVGDLVCIKSHNIDNFGNGWLMSEVSIGIVIEIIEIETDFYLYNHKTRCYDYLIYWTDTEKIESIPDLIIERFSDWQRRTNEGILRQADW